VFANSDSKDSQPLNSKELLEIKKKFEDCVIKNGRLLLKKTTFRDAMEYAPLACRKELLQAKKYLLNSAFKIEVIDQLVSSIDEGVTIDLANDLIKQLEKQ
jgi:hypothetical protein